MRFANNVMMSSLLALMICCTAFAAKKDKTATLEPIGFKNITTAKGKNWYTVIFYRVKKEDFGGKVPERFEFKYPKDLHHGDVFIDFYSWEQIPLFHDDDRKEGFIADNLDNKELEIWLYFPGKVKDWQKKKLLLVGWYMTPEAKKQHRFSDILMDIKGIVGVGPEEDGNWSISIADCIPDINKVLNKARKVAKEYGFKITEIRLLPNYDYVLEEED